MIKKYFAFKFVESSTYLVSDGRLCIARRPAACSISPILTKVAFRLSILSLLHRDDKRKADLICSFSTGLCIALSRIE